MNLLASHNPLEHIVDHAYRTVHVGGLEVTILSKHVVVELLAAVLLIGLVCSVVRRREPVPRGLANFFEAICQYFRVHVAQPALGEHADRFVPYIWTVFFFILFCNLSGLIPFSATPTGNIWTTGTLAVFSLVMIVINGCRVHGAGYLKHFCPGPLWLAPLLVPVELLGLIAKIFALAVRLFANMVAGHILLVVLLMLVNMAFAAMGASLGPFLIAVPVVLGSVAINLLEIFVAFLQAFIFTFLTALFIGQAVGEAHEAGAEAHD